MPDACKHWWINQGTTVKRKGALMVEYRCEICGQVEYYPAPIQKGPGNGKRSTVKGRKGKRGSGT